MGTPSMAMAGKCRPGAPVSSVLVAGDDGAAAGGLARRGATKQRGKGPGGCVPAKGVAGRFEQAKTGRPCPAHIQHQFGEFLEGSGRVGGHFIGQRQDGAVFGGVVGGSARDGVPVRG